MNEWWSRKKQKSRERRKNKNEYTFIDLIIDILFWLPELILLPFRIVFWLFRGVIRMIGNYFDIV